MTLDMGTPRWPAERPETVMGIKDGAVVLCAQSSFIGSARPLLSTAYWPPVSFLTRTASESKRRPRGCGCCPAVRPRLR